MDIQGSFTLGGIPRNGATVKLWSAGSFASRPSKGTAIPSGSPLDSTDTGTTHGSDGAYRFESVSTGEYYVSIEWNSTTAYDYHDVRDGTEGLGWTLSQDYANLALAIAATPSGNTLYIAQGTYQLTAGLTVAKQINIKGAGKGAIIQAAAGSLDLLTYNNISGFVVENIFFDASGQTLCNGLVLSGCGQATIRDATAKGLVAGFRFNNCNSIQAAACLLSGCTAAGIHVSGGTNFTFEQCNYVQISPSYDLRAEGTWNVLRVDNAKRVYAVSGTHLLLTNHRNSESGSTLEISGSTSVFNPTQVKSCNVRDYGAKGDDSTDDWASIQSAVLAAKLMGTTNTGTDVICPPGRYVIRQPIVLPRSSSTPTNVVHLVGMGERVSRIKGHDTFFPNDRALIEWEDTAARSWHQRIANLELVLPNVSGTMAIHYEPTDKSTGTLARAELWQGTIENINIEASNIHHQRLIYMEGNIKESTFRNIYGDPGSPASWVYDTLLLEFDTNDLGEDDAAGCHYSQIDCIYAGNRRGGYCAALKGRFHRSTISTVLAGIGCVDDPTFWFEHCSAIHVRDVANEGTGEKPQIFILDCTGCVFEHVTVGTPTDPGKSMGLGNGIELYNSHDIVFRGQFRRFGGFSFASSGKKHLVVDSDCRRCTFENFDIITSGGQTVSGEVTFSAPASGGCYGEFFDKRSSTFQTLGQKVVGMQQIQNGGWDTEHLMLGAYHIWVDATGDVRIKSSAPTTDLDGTVIGTQS